MIISRTPYRISFFGGGTDYPTWYRDNGGAVLAATIDKYCYLTVRHLPPFFEHRIRVVYSKIETCQTIDEIVHPAVREILRYLKIERGVEIHHDGDLPARSGMGSSSSFSVGLLHALHALKGNMPGKHQLAMEGIYAEQTLLKETVGSQDQVSAAYGGLNHITFSRNDEVSVRPVTISMERTRELNAHLMLFYTSIKRTASDIAGSYVSELAHREGQLRLMKDMVEESISILATDTNIKAFGKLLHEAWQAKRSLSTKISNPEIDAMYEQVRAAGAIGGKITGAGGGGFMLLFVPPEQQAKVRQAMSNLIHVPIQFEFSGSQIIFFDPETDYADAEKTRATQSIRAFREVSHH